MSHIKCIWDPGLGPPGTRARRGPGPGGDPGPAGTRARRGPGVPLSFAPRYRSAAEDHFEMKTHHYVASAGTFCVTPWSPCQSQIGPNRALGPNRAK